MSDKLKLYDLAPSPNNMKVHIALNFKELAWERIPVDFQDRTEVVKVSGQPLTPVLVHGDRVVFDSAAILRYLDGNFRNTRPLFASDRDTMKAIEEWEVFGRTEIPKPVSMVFQQAFAEKKDPAVFAQASRLLDELTARIEARLAEGDYLVGNRLTAADVTAAPWVSYGMLPPEAAKLGDIHALFASNLKLGSGRDRTRAWVGRVMAYNS
ncbi:MAG: glutathione S-transferase family protein [Acidobacteriota bacterium]